MTPPSSITTIYLASAIIVVILLSLLPSSSHAFGSGATLAVTDASATVCGIVAGEPTHRIDCYRRGQIIPVAPNISFSSVSGGRDFFCGIRSDTPTSLHLWDTSSNNNTTFFQRKRLSNGTVPLENLASGETHVCATVVGAGNVTCWRTNNTFEFPPRGSDQFASISSGSGFSCGILKNGSLVRCWGERVIASQIEKGFGNMSMWSLVAGGSHVCGLNATGFLVCRGKDNIFGQLDVPQQGGGSWEYTGLALGENHSCAIRRLNGSVVCWGGNGQFSLNVTESVSFELIVSGSNFTCGLISNNFSVMCWGPGWPNYNASRFELLPLPPILPGPCVQSSCGECGVYPDSQSLCSASGNNICRPCEPQLVPVPEPSPGISPRSKSSRSKTLTRGLLAFAIVGSVGGFAGICTVLYCIWSGTCFGKKKVHNSVQPTITRGGSGGSNGNGASSNNNSPPSRSSTTIIKRQGSRILRFQRQRSGTSSIKNTAEEFTFAELVAATNNFSLENKLGGGSYGVVYKGKLADGREVAIKRGETGSNKMKKKFQFQEKESAFESELAFLSRLHHKHLVRLVGFCEEKDERLLVYEYMKNGALYDHLHSKNNVEKSSSFLNSWKMRIKIALDASRGIEYLHNYAVPSIIHRDIKSSNILLDANWTARVSDFGLSLMSPEPDDHDEHQRRPMKAAGTVGYIDPEYYGLNVLTAKSDVYGLGVVLLELLTGKRAIFKNGGEDGGGDNTPMSVVDFAVPAIMAGELVKILDPRVGTPEFNETEAVELVAYTAMHCVNLEGKDRPTMSDIVANLERALALCEDSHGSISSGIIYVGSD